MFIFKNSFKKGLLFVGLVLLNVVGNMHACGRNVVVNLDSAILDKLTLNEVEKAIVELHAEKKERQVLREAGDCFLSTTAGQEACLADIDTELRALVSVLQKHSRGANAMSGIGNYGFAYVDKMERLAHVEKVRKALSEALGSDVVLIAVTR